MQPNDMAITEIYETFRNPLKSFIRKRISDSAAVEDLVHDVFLRIHSRIDTLQSEEKLTSWVYTIARNAVTDYYRKRKETIPEIPQDLAENTSEKLDDVTERLVPVVRRMIDQLPQKYREPLWMADFENIPYLEIAKTLSLSLSGVKSRVQRARKMLKDLLLQCCHFEFDRYGTVFDYYPRKCDRCC